MINSFTCCNCPRHCHFIFHPFGCLFILFPDDFINSNSMELFILKRDSNSELTSCSHSKANNNARIIKQNIHPCATHFLSLLLMNDVNKFPTSITDITAVLRQYQSLLLFACLAVLQSQLPSTTYNRRQGNTKVALPCWPVDKCYYFAYDKVSYVSYSCFNLEYIHKIGIY